MFEYYCISGIGTTNCAATGFDTLEEAGAYAKCFGPGYVIIVRRVHTILAVEDPETGEAISVEI